MHSNVQESRRRVFGSRWNKDEKNEEYKLDVLMEYYDESDLDSLWEYEKDFCAACLMGKCIVIVFENRNELRLRWMGKIELGCVV